MDRLSGLGSLSRKRLSDILRASKGVITIELASEVLNITPEEASKILSYWTTQGWLYRIKRGLYVPVPLESSTSEPAIEDPWIIANYLFDPCYIGGWSAAEYWELTEQIYKSIAVITRKRERKNKLTYGNTSFFVKSVSPKAFFGYTGIWRGQVKVNVSDPDRTIVDMLNDIYLGGGIRPIFDMFINYMKSEKSDLNTIIEYAKKQNNRTVFKRLGFFLEQRYPEEKAIIEQCHDLISSGYSKLDPNLKSDRLVTRWKLWIPESWDRVSAGDK